MYKTVTKTGLNWSCGTGTDTHRNGSNVLLCLWHLGQVNEERNCAWNTANTKLSFCRTWLANVSAATTSSGRPKEFCNKQCLDQHIVCMQCQLLSISYTSGNHSLIQKKKKQTNSIIGNIWGHWHILMGAGLMLLSTTSIIGSELWEAPKSI